MYNLASEAAHICKNCIHELENVQITYLWPRHHPLPESSRVFREAYSTTITFHQGIDLFVGLI